MRESVRIGNGCGFWGDNVDAPIVLAETGRLDYLTLEYLAELTMSILVRQRQRNPQAGYASDFIEILERLVPILQSQPELRIVTNAGGINAVECARQARQVLDRGGMRHRRVAWVGGDDLLPRLDDLLAAGHELRHLDNARPLRDIRSNVVSANAYLGAQAIADALSQGASVVITGRVADASLTVGPAVHELGWSWDAWDLLAAATVAGHLIECGAQATGGLWCNWTEAADLAHVGYPIVEIQRDGVFRITKPEGSGGAVNFETVSEQLLYEVGDPSTYVTPDVIADFTSVRFVELGTDAVEASGIRGRPATDQYKVSIAYRDGFTAAGTLAVFGTDAAAKAKACGEMILERVRRGGYDLEHTLVECLGSGAVVPGVLPPPEGLTEVMLRVAVHDSRREAVARFARELAPLVTSGPPGITGYATGRPQVRDVFAYWPSLIDKSAVSAAVHMIE